ncbi:MAG: glycosyl hydrolase, partial [Verrucomicrobiota bacterium]
PRGEPYRLILRDIDAIALQLQKASAAGIPILWRPLHEAPGGWFWWGAQGPAAFQQLWRLLYQRLTVRHGLHNLIWVLTSEDEAWYPGDDVVDVVGVDAYPAVTSDSLVNRWEPLLARFNGKKPLALTEFGGVPDISYMRRLGVNWAWFTTWTGFVDREPAAKIAAVYRSPDVLTAEGRVPARE